MVRKTISCIILLSVFVIVGCGPKGYLIRPVPLQQDLQETEIERDEGGFIKSKIAVIDVDGMMFNKQKWGLLRIGENPVSLFVEKLDKAQKDKDVKAVVLRLNSPGGTVGASDIMYHRLREFRRKSGKPVGLTLFLNWAIKPFTMYAIALFFLGVLFRTFIGPDSVDLVKLPFGLDLPVGANHGAGTVVVSEGVKMLQVPLWRSYLAGCILLGIAPCTAMVLVWGYLARGNDGLTLVMVAINSLTMLVLYGILGGFLLGVGRLPVPWQALLLSISIYVALPLVAGFVSRKWIIARKGETWFKEKFLHLLTPITIIALLITLILVFSFKGDVILSNPLTILWIAIPLFIQTNLIFWIGYGLARVLKLRYKDAAPAAMIGASNHFEVAIATSTMLFGLSSGAALATVIGVLVEVPVMLMLVRICLKTQKWFT